MKHFYYNLLKITEGKRRAALSTIYRFPLHVALVPLCPKFDSYLNAIPFYSPLKHLYHCFDLFLQGKRLDYASFLQPFPILLSDKVFLIR